MPKVDEKAFVNFYNFWRWEYTRRNKLYSHVVNAIFSGYIPANVESVKAGNSWGKLVLCGEYTLRVYSKSHLPPELVPQAPSGAVCEFLVEWPQAAGKDFLTYKIDEPEQFDVEGTFLYGSSSEILDAIIMKELEHAHPILSDDFSRYISEKMTYDIRLDSIRWLDRSLYNIVATVWVREILNGKCDLPKITKIADGHSKVERSLLPTPLSWREEREELILKNGEELVLVDMNRFVEEIVSDIKKFYNTYHGLPDYQSQERIIRGSGNIKRLPRELPRAIGLWLWDYLEERKIAWEFRSKSYEAFRNHYQSSDSELFIDGYSQPSQLAMLLDNAHQCIQRMEVLPMG